MRAFIFTTTRIRAAGLLVVLAASWLLPSSQAADFVNYPDLGLRLQQGFRVSLYADSGLANDIYAMTLDARGRVVVTSAGYIKTLLDTDGNGVADSAKIFATPAQGGMGLCFDGTSLFYSGDGWLSRYDDRNGDGQADGPPENLFPLGLGEHGGHAIRKGPDGWWHLIGGNDTGFDRRHVTLAGSPVRDVEAGALLRISPNGKNSEVVAHGFRNPYDFDFNFAGELFTYDSDKESDLFLPWNSPTRLYQIGHGQHHGWRLNGFKRSWARPDYYADTVNILWNIGRGSPTGVTSYRRTQFPRATATASSRWTGRLAASFSRPCRRTAPVTSPARKFSWSRSARTALRPRTWWSRRMARSMLPAADARRVARFTASTFLARPRCSTPPRPTPTSTSSCSPRSRSTPGRARFGCPPR